jgi:hypothetical protein
VRQGHELVHLSPIQVDALLTFLETVSRLVTEELRAVAQALEDER